VETLVDFIDYLSRRWDTILELGIEHAAVVVIAVGLATFIGVGLGVLSFRNGAFRSAAIATTGVFLTIPSFALFGILIGFVGLGWTPTIVALTMYSLLPITRNTVTGLRGVDAAIVESARGMGMSPLHTLLRIELPLAWPVILTGMRVSTQLAVGIAAIAAVVNGPGLGNHIFSGLSRLGGANALDLALGGTLGVIILAVLFDAVYIAVTKLTTSKGIR
jgi:osmoprotectant transport system permease protein